MSLELRYEIVRELGQGAFGRVVLVCDRMTKERFAAKVLTATDSDARSRFLNEAGQLSVYGLVGVPRVVRIQKAFLNDEPPFFVMTWASGGSVLPWAGRLEPAQVLLIIKQLTEALSLIHLTGGYHRDVKPDNVLLLGDGSVVLADFGLGNQPLGGRAMTNSPAGTAGYAAPELRVGEGFSAASDMYSVGATAFHLLTGRHPNECVPPLHPIRMDPVATLRSVGAGTAGAYATATRLIYMMTDPQPRGRITAAVALLLASRVLERSAVSLPTGAPPQPSRDDQLVSLFKKLILAGNNR